MVEGSETAYLCVAELQLLRQIQWEICVMNQGGNGAQSLCPAQRQQFLIGGRLTERTQQSFELGDRTRLCFWRLVG